MNACCSICGATTGIVTGRREPSLWFCTEPVECNARARLALGIPAGLVRQMRAREWRAVIAAREAARA